jgi:hypothetical protein
VVLVPMVCLTVGGDVLVMVVKLSEGHVYDSGVCVMAGCSVYWCVDSSSRVSSSPSTMASLIVLFVKRCEFHQMIEIEGWMKMLSRQACSSS